MAGEPPISSRAQSVIALFAIIGVATDLATSTTFGVGPWITQEAHPAVFLGLYLTGRLIFLTWPIVALWFGLVLFRKGGSRPSAIFYIALGSVFSMVSFVFAMSWLSLQDKNLHLITQYRPAIEIAEVAKNNILPLEKRAEITVILAQMQYVNQGTHATHLRPDGKWQTFVPSANDVAKRQERVAMADSFKGSIVLCIMWAVYAVLGFVVALVAGIRWKVAATEG